ncbi:MAG: ribokinase [Candidatus Bipolaricaulota bacterium]|nr:ribokinase [Candidatus Bipolaricaulota bacterium]MDW8126449.1 ribokinase [Candidatus Bipolaricaulota bacterium]
MKVAVLGSLNMDLVTNVERLPQPGETVGGRSFARYPGGKGLNQAVAAARLGAQVVLFGRVGQDEFGEELLSVARENGVDVSLVEKVEAQTGTATVLVDPKGENMIAYAPGANALVDKAYLDRILPILSTVDVLLLQLEIPLSTVAEVLSRLPAERPLVILNPSPAQDLRVLPLGRVDVLVPNAQEFQALTGWSGNPEELERAGRRLLGRGVKTLVVTAGSDGAYLVESEGITHFPAFPAAVVDATGAGDAFCAALAVKLGSGRGFYEAIGFANAAAALATTKKGAVPSLPTLSDVQAFLAKFAN